MGNQIPNEIREIPTGLPIDLLIEVRDQLSITTFVETGVGLGRSSTVASHIFDQCFTIEADKGRYEKARAKFKGANVQPLHGESPEALEKLIAVLEDERFYHGPIVFFLDAHCFYRPQIEDVPPCPLLDEINLIDCQHVVIVDDESAFTSVPHPRHLRRAYPELPKVIDALRFRGENTCDPFIFIEGKVIMAVPRTIQEAVEDFLHERRYA
jgi:hypothetical protein